MLSHQHGNIIILSAIVGLGMVVPSDNILLLTMATCICVGRQGGMAPQRPHQHRGNMAMATCHMARGRYGNYPAPGFFNITYPLSHSNQISDICSDLLQLNCYAFCSSFSVQRLVLREFDTVLAAESILYWPLIAREYVPQCRLSQSRQRTL